MMISIYILVILAGLFVTLLFCLAWAWEKIRDVSLENKYYRALVTNYFRQACEYAQERDIALARAKSHCSFWELRKDERIEELEAENRALRESMQEV